MAMMKYGTAKETSQTSLQAWGQVKSSAVSREEEEERKKAQELSRNSK